MNEAVSVRHPSIYRLIEVFQDIEAANERNIAQLIMEAAPKRKRGKYVVVNEAIQRVWLKIPLVVVFQRCNVSSPTLMLLHINYGTLNINEIYNINLTEQCRTL